MAVKWRTSLTKEKFEKAAKQNKTVISMDYIEGEEDSCTTGVYGNPNIILEQISKKVAFIFAQLTASCKIDAVKNIDILCDNIKVYYAKFLSGAKK